MADALGHFLLLGLFASAAIVEAVEELIVGQGGLPWTQVVEESAFFSVTADSIWLQGASEGQNLGLDIMERGGRVLLAAAPRNAGGASSFVEIPELARMLDGNRGTAFNPDEAGVSRDAEIYIDLGAPFRIVWVRLFPRLDSDHQSLFLQSFDLGIHNGKRPLEALEGIQSLAYRSLMYFSLNLPNEKSVVDWPGQRQVTGIRDARYIRLRPLSGLPWEIAELEIYTDGKAPEGTFLSQPLLVHRGSPIWGRVRYEDGAIAALPIEVRARTGPDSVPLHYFAKTGVGGDVERVSRQFWERSDGRGPVKPNPLWTTWQVLNDGVVQASHEHRYIQFELRTLKPGVLVRRLVFEYDVQPLVDRLAAEIRPALIDPGIETLFTLSMRVDLNRGRGDTGFRHIELVTPAEILAVDSVLVNDRASIFTPDIKEGGFAVHLWRRVDQDGVVRIVFRGRVYAAATPFVVRVFDRRFVQGHEETVSQFAEEEGTGPESTGIPLVVWLRSGQVPLLDVLTPPNSVLTPNGDGVNDVFSLEINIFKLTRPGIVLFEIFDLAGNRVAHGAAEHSQGQFVRLWDGRGSNGQKVSPGLYLYRIRMETDAGTTKRQGLVSVLY